MSLDIAKGISVLSMVGLHSNLSDGYYYPVSHAIFVNYLMLYLVPFFFFVSGVFYKHKTTKILFFEKFSGLIKPVLFTVIFYNFFFLINGLKFTKIFTVYSSFLCMHYGLCQPFYAL
ncbi:acyltransferase family protein [Xenorhabdus bovienii]|uniref:acyltransferase family protein n=1 Tax=Xenorhabdus bovienii TaxID=40576 RepID=UPI0039B5625A